LSVIASSGKELSVQENAILIAHTDALAVLMEVHHTLIDLDETAYISRLACAKDMAEMVILLKDSLTYNEALISAGYCWCLAAEVLIQHIQLNEEGGAISSEQEHQLAAGIVNVLERLGETIPALVQQFKHVQQFLGRIDSPTHM